MLGLTRGATPQSRAAEGGRGEVGEAGQSTDVRPSSPRGCGGCETGEKRGTGNQHRETEGDDRPLAGARRRATDARKRRDGKGTWAGNGDERRQHAASWAASWRARRAGGLAAGRLKRASGDDTSRCCGKRRGNVVATASGQRRAATHQTQTNGEQRAAPGTKLKGRPRHSRCTTRPQLARDAQSDRLSSRPAASVPQQHALACINLPRPASLTGWPDSASYDHHESVACMPISLPMLPCDGSSELDGRHPGRLPALALTRHAGGTALMYSRQLVQGAATGQHIYR